MLKPVAGLREILETPETPAIPETLETPAIRETLGIQEQPIRRKLQFRRRFRK